MSPLSSSLRRAVVAAAVIVVGLALRIFGPGLGLPFAVTKWGGSILWAAMVYFLIALLAGARRGETSPRATSVATVAVAFVVEFSRLVHTPELDAFRLTPMGALLLGRVFSPWNLVAYLIGIGLAVMIDRGTLGFPRRSPRS